MDNILYRFNYFKQTFLLIPILAIIIVFFLRLDVASIKSFFGCKYAGTKKKSFKQRKKLYEFEKILLIFAFVLGCLSSRQYIAVSKAYRNGTYQIVEGYVENFKDKKTGMKGEPPESFDINNIHFFYSEGIMTCGYNKERRHGGVITGDGQRLKIGYINVGKTYIDDGYNDYNVIVYIEQLDDTVQSEEKAISE